MIRVLFVCLGNICRSPMAEAVFMEKVRRAGLAGEIQADSAGTGHWHIGEPPHHGTRKVLATKGISYAGRARLLDPEDLRSFHYVIAMDRHNLRDIHELGQTELDFSGRSGTAEVDKPTAQVTTLMSFAPEMGHDEVPDPYYNGRFDDVYHLVEEATDKLLETIRREQGI